MGHSIFWSRILGTWYICIEVYNDLTSFQDSGAWAAWEARSSVCIQFSMIRRDDRNPAHCGSISCCKARDWVTGATAPNAADGNKNVATLNMHRNAPEAD